ncbi:phage terminase large subunit family protein [Salmonella enterica]|nr:phage terminase large subunit family protein [Salmonella enterica]
MRKNIIQLYRLTDGQKFALKDRARNHVICGGEMSGKTTVAIHTLIPHLLAGRRCVWIAANENEQQKARGIIRDQFDDWITRSNQTQVVFSNGALVDVLDWQNLPKKLDVDYGALVADDIHLMPGFAEFWDKMGRDLIRNKKGGETLFTGCAMGKLNDCWRMYSRGFEDFGWSCADLPTKANAVWLPLELLQAMRDTPEPERVQRFECYFHDHGIMLTADHKVLRPGETFRQWCERLAADGLMVDGKPYALDNRPAMAYLYDQIPATHADAHKKTVVFLKGAQLGFSVFEMLASLYLGLRFPGVSISMFVPTMQLSNHKSKMRFIPMCRSVPAINRLMSDSEDGEGNIRSRKIGATLYNFSYAAGKVSTESNPADIICLDETQELTDDQLSKIKERYSSSSIRLLISGSTANMPSSDIHAQYLEGTQHEFYTECPGCGVMEPMIRSFPDNLIRKPQGGYRYECTRCHAEITDPQRGEWRAAHPERAEGEYRTISLHFPQFLSPTVSASDIGLKYESVRSKKSFYNRVLGWPWIDADAIPVTIENLAACAEAGKRLGVTWESKGDGRSDYFLGIDQMKGLQGHIVKKRLPSGHLAVVYIELFHGDDPFARTAELMELYNIKAACIELNPSANEALKLARAFPGRVFVVNSFNLPDDIVSWGDRWKGTPSENRTADEFVNRFTCRINQYFAMDYSLSLFDKVNPKCVIPGNYTEMVTQRRTKRGLENCNAAEEFFYHLSKTALVTEYDEEEAKSKSMVMKVGGFDPHLSYANHLCDVATMRDIAPNTMIIPDPITGEIIFQHEVDIIPTEPVLPQASEVTDVIAEAVAARFASDKCGSCRFCVPVDKAQPYGVHYCGIDPNRMRTDPNSIRCFDYYERDERRTANE